MDRFELGISFGGLPVERVRPAAEAGVKWAETYLGPGKDPNETVQAWGEGTPGMRVWSVHAPFGKDYDLASFDPEERMAVIGRWGESFDLAKKLGAGVVVVHPGLELPLNTTHRQERLDALRVGLVDLTAAYGGMGIKIAVETLPRTCLGNTAEELAWLVRDCDPAATGYCLDANHFQPSTNLVAAVHTLRDRLITLHISDHDDVDERHWLPGRGVVDWASFIGALREVGYQGPFMYEVGLKWDDPQAAVAEVLASYNSLPW